MDDADHTWNRGAIHAAIGGFGYLGHAEAGRVLAAASETAFPDGGIGDSEQREHHMLSLADEVTERLEELDDEYHSLVPEDRVLEERFRQRLQEQPAHFAGVG